MLPSAALPSALRPPRAPRARPSAPRDLKASEPSAGQVPRVRFPRSPQTTLAAPTLYPPAAPVPRRWLTPAFVCVDSRGPPPAAFVAYTRWSRSSAPLFSTRGPSSLEVRPPWSPRNLKPSRCQAARSSPATFS